MSMDVDTASVLGRQNAVKKAGLRSVRSACGTTWSEVAGFAEQDTTNSSGDRPLYIYNCWYSSTGEECKIHYIIYMCMYIYDTWVVEGYKCVSSTHFGRFAKLIERVF